MRLSCEHHLSTTNIERTQLTATANLINQPYLSPINYHPVFQHPSTSNNIHLTATSLTTTTTTIWTQNNKSARLTENNQSTNSNSQQLQQLREREPKHKEKESTKDIVSVLLFRGLKADNRCPRAVGVLRHTNDRQQQEQQQVALSVAPWDFWESKKEQRDSQLNSPEKNCRWLCCAVQWTHSSGTQIQVLSTATCTRPRFFRVIPKRKTDEAKENAIWSRRR